MFIERHLSVHIEIKYCISFPLTPNCVNGYQRVVLRVITNILYTLSTHLQYVRDGLKQLNEFSKPIVGNTALFTKVVVVSWDEFIEGHATLWGVS